MGRRRRCEITLEEEDSEKRGCQKMLEEYDVGNIGRWKEQTFEEDVGRRRCWKEKILAEDVGFIGRSKKKKRWKKQTLEKTLEEEDFGKPYLGRRR